MNWVALLVFAGMPAVSLFGVYSAVKDVLRGQSQIYGRPMVLRQDVPLEFAVDIGLKLILSALLAVAPFFATLELLRA